MENDILICETGNGGDAKIQGNDIVMTGGIHNQVYLGWFGGNVEASTVHRSDQDILDDEERLDWWGNSLLYENEPSVQFNSSLERGLKDVSLNSEGRLFLEERALIDLEFLGSFASVTTDVIVSGVDKAEISATLQQPDNVEDKTFSFIWDNTKLENTCESCKGAGVISSVGGGFSDGFSKGFDT